MRSIHILVYAGLCSMLCASPGMLPAAAAGFYPARHAGKVVIVDFWASWCTPCRRSFPWLNAMQAKYADRGLVVVGVNLDNDPQAARAFLERYPARFEIVYDDDKTLARRFDVVAMPSSYLLGRDGNLIETHLGFKVREQDAYERAIVAALDRTGP